MAPSTNTVHAAKPIDVLATASNGGSVMQSLKDVDTTLLKPSVIAQLEDVSSLEEQRGALVLHSGQVLATDTALTGGKGSSLAILTAIDAVDVPAFFCVTTNAFRTHFQSEHTRNMLDKLQDLTNKVQESRLQTDLVAVFKQAAELRKYIESGDLEQSTEEAIKDSYAQLGADVAVAVRSSATTEDTKDASFAGQHDTFLNQRGAADVVLSVRKCWASIFTDRAVEYRGRSAVPHKDAVMSVVVQVMVDPYVAGTSFSLELSTGYPAIHIAATYGLGEAVVSGEVTSDEWLIDLEAKGDKVVKRVKGSKEYEFIMKSDRSGVDHVSVDEARRSRYCMESSTTRKVAMGTRCVQRVYKQLFGYEHIDTEFAVNKSGDVLVLQSRPVVPVSNDSILTVDRHDISTGDGIVKSAYSLLGAVSGRCKVINDFDLLVSGEVTIDADDILVTAKTSNYWNQYLTNLRGIVTMDGSPTAHPMLIGRERNLPVLCGIPGLLQKVGPFDGKIITIDGLAKWMYRGERRLRTATREEIQSEFAVQQPVKPKGDNDIISFLTEYHRMRRDKNGEIWIHNPNTPLSPAWCAIRRSIYRARLPLVNSARISKLTEDPFGPENCTFPGNVVADKYWPAEKTMSAFGGMTLEECDRYHKCVDNAAQKYLSVCASFANRPSVQGWRDYLAAYAPLYAALWLSYFWRGYMKLMSSTAANEAGMSQFHYGQMLAETQEEMQHLEEDASFRHQIVELADSVRPFILTSAEKKQFASEGSVRMSTKSVLALALSSAETRDKIEMLAKSFRIEKNTDIAIPAPISLVVEKIVEALETGAVAPHRFEGSHRTSVEFFPGNADLEEAIRLHIYSRVQNSNCHHWKWRGQWKIKEGLQTVAKAVGLNLLDLLKMDVPEKIEAEIQKYEERCPEDRQPAPSGCGDSAGDVKLLRKEMAEMKDLLLHGLLSLQKEVQAQRTEIADLRRENAALRVVGVACPSAGSGVEAVRSARLNRSPSSGAVLQEPV